MEAEWNSAIQQPKGNQSNAQTSRPDSVLEKKNKEAS